MIENFDPLVLTPIAILATAITAGVMKLSAGWFDKERFAPVVSLIAGIVAAIICQQFFMTGVAFKAAIGWGLVVGFGASGLWDHFKAVTAIKNGK